MLQKVHLCGISIVTAYLVDIFAASSISPLSLLLVSSFSGNTKVTINKYAIQKTRSLLVDGPVIQFLLLVFFFNFRFFYRDVFLYPFFFSFSFQFFTEMGFSFLQLIVADSLGRWGLYHSSISLSHLSTRL